MVRLGLRPVPGALLFVALSTGVTPASAQAPASRPPDGAPPPQLSGGLQRVVDAVATAVVEVRVLGNGAGDRERRAVTPEPLRSPGSEPRGPAPEFERRPPLPRTGSGFVVDPNGYIVTTDQLLSGARIVEVTLNDGRRLPVTLIARDADNDVAVLKVEATGLPTVPLAPRSYTPRAGDGVIAVGRTPLRGSPVTVGTVSSTGTGGPASALIRTDIAAGPHAVGGPLVDLRGRAVGIVTAKSTGPGAQDTSLVIPIDRAKPILRQLRGRTPG